MARTLERANVKGLGKHVLIYGENGVGKTTSWIDTLPLPALCIWTEVKAPWSSFEALGFDEAEIEFIQPESYEDFMDILNKIENGSAPGGFEYGGNKYRSLVVDNMSMWVNDTDLIERMDKSSKVKSDVWDMYLSLGLDTLAMIKAMARISKKGPFVLNIAQCEANPDWNKKLDHAPHFAGSVTNKSLGQHYDCIGLVVPMSDKEGKATFPPGVSFRSANGTYQAKWSGKHLNTYNKPLNFKTLFEGE